MYRYVLQTSEVSIRSPTLSVSGSFSGSGSGTTASGLTCLLKSDAIRKLGGSLEKQIEILDALYLLKLQGLILTPHTYIYHDSMHSSMNILLEIQFK